MSPFERLLHQLPPERRVEAALALEKLAHDHHSPVFDLYAEILVSIHVKSQAMEARMVERLAAAEQREEQRAVQLAKDHKDQQTTIRQEIGALSGNKLWKRVITSKIIGAVMWGIALTACMVAIQEIYLERDIAPLHEIITAHRNAVSMITDDPASLAAYAKYTNKANSEALDTAMSLHAISKLMTMPKMQLYRGDDGFLIITGDANQMPIGTYSDGRNWVKLANPIALVSADTTPSIDKATEAGKKLNQK
jgi:hypothetical protein